MVDLIAALSRLDTSAFVALLLLALLASLKWIGKGIIARLETLERTIDEFRKTQQQHTTSLAIIRTRLTITEEELESHE